MFCVVHGTALLVQLSFILVCRTTSFCIFLLIKKRLSAKTICHKASIKKHTSKNRESMVWIITWIWLSATAFPLTHNKLCHILLNKKIERALITYRQRRQAVFPICREAVGVRRLPPFFDRRNKEKWRAGIFRNVLNFSWDAEECFDFSTSDAAQGALRITLKFKRWPYYNIAKL